MKFNLTANGFVTCMWCGEPIDAEHYEMPHIGDGTFNVEQKPWHVECLTRSISGGLNHLLGRCSCCGGTEEPDPPEMTKREAAIAAFKHFRSIWVPL